MMIYSFNILTWLCSDLYVSLSVYVCPSAIQSYRCGSTSRGSTSYTPPEGPTGKHWFRGQLLWYLPARGSPNFCNANIGGANHCVCLCTDNRSIPDICTSKFSSCPFFVNISSLWPGHKVSTCTNFSSSPSMRCRIWVVFNVSFGQESGLDLSNMIPLCSLARKSEARIHFRSLYWGQQANQCFFLNF